MTKFLNWRWLKLLLSSRLLMFLNCCSAVSMWCSTFGECRSSCLAGDDCSCRSTIGDLPSRRLMSLNTGRLQTILLSCWRLIKFLSCWRLTLSLYCWWLALLVTDLVAHQLAFDTAKLSLTGHSRRSMFDVASLLVTSKHLTGLLATDQVSQLLVTDDVAQLLVTDLVVPLFVTGINEEDI